MYYNKCWFDVVKMSDVNIKFKKSQRRPDIFIPRCFTPTKTWHIMYLTATLRYIVLFLMLYFVFIFEDEINQQHNN